jgi:hypothetical protein
MTTTTTQTAANIFPLPPNNPVSVGGILVLLFLPLLMSVLLSGMLVLLLLLLLLVPSPLEEKKGNDIFQISRNTMEIGNCQHINA